MNSRSELLEALRDSVAEAKRACGRADASQDYKDGFLAGTRVAVYYIAAVTNRDGVMTDAEEAKLIEPDL